MVFLPDHGGVEVDPEENVYNEDTDGSLGESGDAIVRATRDRALSPGKCLKIINQSWATSF